MHEIEMHEASTEFTRCWNAAGAHLSQQMQSGLNSWLRAHLDPPWLEHLSFMLGNQLFFVRIEDEAGRLRVPGSREGLMSVARGCAGHACLMTMRGRLGSWRPTTPGWGLIDIRTGRPVEPPDLVTAEPVEMTDWELHDFAVQVVREQLESEVRQQMSWQSNPGVDPSIWFVGDDGPEWVQSTRRFWNSEGVARWLIDAERATANSEVYVPGAATLLGAGLVTDLWGQCMHPAPRPCLDGRPARSGRT